MLGGCATPSNLSADHFRRPLWCTFRPFPAVCQVHRWIVANDLIPPCTARAVGFSFRSHKFDNDLAQVCSMERKLRVENRFLNRHEQTCHEHDQFTFHARVRITGRLVRVAFTSMLIEITGSELVLINLHDTRCAERGEVSRVGTSHRDEVNVAFDAHLYGTWLFSPKHLSFSSCFCVS